MTSWSKFTFGRGESLTPTSREPVHQPHPEAAAAEKAFTDADRRMLEVEQRLNQSPGGAEFARRVRGIR